MSVNLSPLGGAGWQFFDNSGTPLSGGLLYTYAAGTTTPTATYTSSAGTVAQANPIVLDSAGRVPSEVWLTTLVNYKFVLKDSTDVLIATYDNIYGINQAPIIPTPADASLVAYDPPGTGAVTTDVQTKLRESVSPEDFGAVGDGVTDDGPAFVLACNYCSLNGATLRLSPKVYLNARVEVHGTYCVEGNGATVQFVGVGQTIIAGSGSGASAYPSPWPTDAGYSPAYDPTTMYNIASAVTAGNETITLSSVSGITEGMILFLAGNPSGNSSPSNYIPADFEFVTVRSIAGNVITVESPVLSSYTTAGALFYTPGLAVNCHIKDLTIDCNSGAYAHVVRSSYNCSFKNIVFSGFTTVGASTFSDNLVYNNIKIANVAGGLGPARGSVSTYYTNINYSNYSGYAFGGQGIFIEESFYKVGLTNVVINGGSLTVVSIQGGTTQQRPKTIIVDNCLFDATTAIGGATAPLLGGSAAQVDFIFNNSTFKGAVTTPDPSQFPSITGTALLWISSTASGNTVKFSNCTFISSNAGPTWPVSAGAFNATLMFDVLCTYQTCTAPFNYIFPYDITGTWVPTISGLSTAGTQTYTTQIGNYIRTGNLVTIQFAVVWSASRGTGDIVLAGLPFNTNATSNGVFTVWDGTLTIAAASAGQFSAGNPRILVSKTSVGAGSIYGTVSYFI